MQRKWSDESKRKHSERMKNVWASNKKMGMSGKQQMLTANGYLFLRLWEHDIKTNKYKCIQLINNLIEF